MRLRMGGVSEDSQAKELKKLFVRAGLAAELRPYDLRGSVNTRWRARAYRYLSSVTPPGFDTLEPLFMAIKARAADVGMSFVL